MDYYVISQTNAKNSTVMLIRMGTWRRIKIWRNYTLMKSSRREVIGREKQENFLKDTEKI